jgi:dienelactone hydrolase
MHELPGITPDVARFGELVAAAGFTAVLPVLFGVPGKTGSLGYTAIEFLRVCVSREFRLLSRRESSPITEWLRALCRQIHRECGGRGVGAIGMCLTGGFALSLMVDESVMAPVLSQPSLPLPVTESHRAALGISDEELAVVKQRSAEGCTILGLRFTADRLCPPERFSTLREELGEGFESIEIDSSPGNRHGNPPEAHSVLTRHMVLDEGHPTREALERVLELFRDRLA